MKTKKDTRLYDAYERTAYGYRNFSHLLIRLEENIVKEKESSNFFFVA